MRNRFSVVIWDMIFGEDEYNVTVPEGATEPVLFDLMAVLQDTNAT